MQKEVFITTTAVYFPNSPIGNNQMEEYLGLISGSHSRVKNIVLRQNGIKQRFYAIDTNQTMTHTNADLAAQSIYNLLAKHPLPMQDLELLACATASPDQILPSHASMVHGLLKISRWKYIHHLVFVYHAFKHLKLLIGAFYLVKNGMLFVAVLNWHQQACYPKL